VVRANPASASAADLAPDLDSAIASLLRQGGRPEAHRDQGAS